MRPQSTHACSGMPVPRAQAPRATCSARSRARRPSSTGSRPTPRSPPPGAPMPTPRPGPRPYPKGRAGPARRGAHLQARAVTRRAGEAEGGWHCGEGTPRWRRACAQRLHRTAGNGATGGVSESEENDHLPVTCTLVLCRSLRLSGVLCVRGCTAPAETTLRALRDQTDVCDSCCQLSEYNNSLRFP